MTDKLRILKSPTLFGLFLCLISAPVWSYSLYEEQIRPTLIKAGDATSVQILLIGSGATVGAHQQDSLMRDQWSQEQVMSRETSGYGYHYGQNALGSVLALTQYYFDPTNGASHIRAIIFTAGVTFPIKLLAQRERPNGINKHSFPSGHSSDVFASATSLSMAYGWKTAVIAYPFASFVALSRVADDAHWFSDTVAGAFLGVWMGRASFHSSFGSAMEENKAESRFQILPTVGHQYLGLNLLGSY